MTPRFYADHEVRNAIYWAVQRLGGELAAGKAKDTHPRYIKQALDSRLDIRADIASLFGFRAVFFKLIDTETHGTPTSHGSIYTPAEIRKIHMDLAKGHDTTGHYARSIGVNDGDWSYAIKDGIRPIGGKLAIKLGFARFFVRAEADIAGTGAESTTGLPEVTLDTPMPPVKAPLSLDRPFKYCTLALEEKEHEQMRVQLALYRHAYALIGGVFELSDKAILTGAEFREIDANLRHQLREHLRTTPEGSAA